MGTTTVRVRLPGGRGHDILVGPGLLRRAGREMRRRGVAGRPFVVTSPRIARLLLRPLLAGLRAAGYRETGLALVPDGDRNKSLESFGRAAAKLVAFGGRRSSGGRPVVVCLGGGVVGDLGGFLAASYRRGVPYVQVPTTLLGFVDCGIGGKTAVNHAGVKNILGAFHQPRLVVADTSVLATLPRREMRSGLAEVIKHGAILSPALFASVERDLARILAADPRVLARMAAANYRIKARIVEKDERETKGLRWVLNYGHTLGHAVESASGMRLRHGEAVAIGIACANDVAVALGLLRRPVADRIERLLVAAGLPVSLRGIPPARVMRFFWSDKKFTGGGNRMVLLRVLGRTVVRDNVPVSLISRVLLSRRTR